MKLERSTPEDERECIEWMTGNLDLNDCSPRTLNGSTFWKIAGVLYLPTKAVLLMDSVAPNPNVSPTKMAFALRRAMDDLRKMYPNTELVFMSRKNTRLGEAATRLYGFEESPYVLYRCIDPIEQRKKSKARKKELAEARLRNNPGTRREGRTVTAGALSDLLQAPRNGRKGRRSQGAGSAGSAVPCLQSRSRTCI